MDEIISKLVEFFGHAGAQAGVLAVVVEFLLRMVKSDKPLSIAYAVARLFRGVGLVATKAAEFLDRILPQKLKEPKV